MIAYGGIYRMKTGSTKKLTLALTLLVLISILLTSLPSCKPTTTPSPDTGASESGSAENTESGKNSDSDTATELPDGTEKPDTPTMPQTYTEVAPEDILIIYASKQAAYLESIAGELATLIGTRCGTTPQAVNNVIAKVQKLSAPYTVYFGYRAELADNYSSAVQIDGKDTYLISPSRNKGTGICVSGTSSAAALCAAAKLETMISFRDGKVLIPDTAVSVKMSASVTIATGESCDYYSAFDRELDYSPDATIKNNGIDLEVGIYNEINKKIKAISGKSPRNGYLLRDYRNVKNTIFIGKVDNEETAAVLGAIAPDEYAIALIGTNIIITGHNETTIQAAGERFLELISAGAKDKTVKLSFPESDGSLPKGSLQEGNLPEGYIIKGKAIGWLLDFPQFSETGTGAKLAGTYDCYNYTLEFYYTGATAADFESYIALLKEKGFSEYTSNKIGNNLYATMTDETRMLHVYYTDYEKTVRVISAYLEGTELPPVEKQPVKAITKPAITQMTLNYAAGSFGMCYIITLSDGSFVIFDGGADKGNTDHIRLYKLLERLNARPDKKIVIAGWFLTHEHYDHFQNFYNFCKAYGKKVTIEAFYHNVTSPAADYNSNNPGNYFPDKFYEASDYVNGGIKLVKIHTGQKLYIRDAEFEVLFTHEDLYPDRLRYFNNSSVTTRMTLGGQTTMWLGDIWTAAADKISDSFGSYVKSDFVQVAHHGYNGATIELYRLISPSVALWPTNQNAYENQTNGKNKNSYYAVDYFIRHNLGLKEIYVADKTEKTFILPYEAGSKSVKEMTILVN